MAVLLAISCAFSSGAVAGGHAFVATYSGTGTGNVAGASAAGAVVARGRASAIGRGTLHGSARGTFTSRTCVTFDGSALLSGHSGSLRLAARGARACATGTAAQSVSFSGTATVTSGTGAVSGAQGSLTFTGTYDGETRALRITFRGNLSY